jgi:hypothetical protein
MGQDVIQQQANRAPYKELEALDVPLGDLLRGERATLGKSLLDVERELKIKASYVAAIENSDLSVFTTLGFVAGYVRSYARYLGLDPEWTFQRFCRESDFSGVHGLSSMQAKQAKRTMAAAPGRGDPNDIISVARVSFTPARETFFSQVEPGALGSAAVLIALVMGIGYGAFAVFEDVQRLQIAPVEQAPTTFTQLDPLTAAQEGMLFSELPSGQDAPFPSTALDRLYRPQALDAPVLIPRDRPIASLDPNVGGNFAPPILSVSSRPSIGVPDPSTVQVTERAEDEVILFAVRPSWIRITSASGTVIYEGTLNRGDSFVLPAAETASTLRAGNAGSLYFAVNGVTFGPAGPGASVARDVVLSADALSATYTMANAEADPDLPMIASLILSSPAADGIPIGE